MKEQESKDAESLEFEWNSDKAQGNIVKHGISFPEAARMLKSGQVYEAISSYEHEKRVLAIGTIENRHVTVVYTMRGKVCRIISARRARRKEREEYERARKNRKLH